MITRSKKNPFKLERQEKSETKNNSNYYSGKKKIIEVEEESPKVKRVRNPFVKTLPETLGISY